MRSSRWLALMPCLVLSAPGVCLAVDARKALYVGGTLHDLPDKAEGKTQITNPNAFVFIAQKGATLSIRWTSIQDLEYGRRVSRRGKTAALKSALAVFSRGEKHYVTITYNDHVGREQVAAFEFGSEIVRPTLAALKEKSGKPLVCQDQEAAAQVAAACDSVLPAESAEAAKK
jgi:hypothetical protein